MAQDTVSKDQQRQQIRALLSVLTTAEKKLESHSVSEQLVNLNPSFISSPVCSFSSTEDEVDLSLFHQHLIDTDILLYMPRYSNDLESYVFCRVTDLSALRPGKYGILEPEDNDTCMSLNEAKEYIATWMVPGLAFDVDGNRLGRGMGWYDRFLVHCKGVKFGVLFDCQLIQGVEFDSLDISMDYLVTPSNTYSIMGSIKK